MHVYHNHEMGPPHKFSVCSKQLHTYDEQILGEMKGISSIDLWAAVCVSIIWVVNVAYIYGALQILKIILLVFTFTKYLPNVSFLNNLILFWVLSNMAVGVGAYSHNHT